VSTWIEPGAYEVGQGVYRIPLPLPHDGLRAVNVYAIADGEQLVLIDSGWALTESEELLVRALDSIGYRLVDVREFLVTHVHRDHYTQAVAIRRAHGTRSRWARANGRAWTRSNRPSASGGGPMPRTWSAPAPPACCPAMRLAATPARTGSCPTSGSPTAPICRFLPGRCG